MILYKRGIKYWNFEDEGVFYTPSKFTINTISNDFYIVYENNLKSKKYNVSEVTLTDLVGSGTFTFANINLFMEKLEELNCPCFQKDVTNINNPPFNPATTDLDVFLNNSADPYVRESEISSGFIYDFLCPINAFVASTLAYVMRFNVGNSIFSPIFEASSYNWTTQIVTTTKITAHPVISTQKVKKVVLSYNVITANITFRLIYFKNTGNSDASTNNIVIFERTLINTAGFKQIEIHIPTEVQIDAGGFLSFVLFNNNVASTVANLHIKLLTTEV